MHTKKLVFFDFDGVIYDSFPSSLYANKRQCTVIPEDVYRDYFSGNINDMNLDEVPGDHSLCSHHLRFEDLFAPHVKEHGRVFAGMPEALQALASRYTLIIVSSSMSDTILHLLESVGVESCVTEILGNDIHTRKTEKFRMALANYEGDASTSILVTDTLGDINEATHVGIPTIAVTWGFQNRVALEQGHPYRIIERSGELVPTIDRFFTEVA